MWPGRYQLLVSVNDSAKSFERMRAQQIQICALGEYDLIDSFESIHAKNSVTNIARDHLAVCHQKPLIRLSHPNPYLE